MNFQKNHKSVNKSVYDLQLISYESFKKFSSW